MREANRSRLVKRFQDAQVAGDLTRDAEPEELARFILTIGWGMAVDAQSGATRDELYRTVARALSAWPA